MPCYPDEWNLTPSSLLRAFNQEQVEYVLIGGVALNLHGLVRATKDVALL